MSSNSVAHYKTKPGLPDLIFWLHKKECPKPSKSPNFTAIEKSVLLELIESRKDIIENKQNDGKMILKKNQEWEKITNEFNASQ